MTMKSTQFLRILSWILKNMINKNNIKLGTKSQKLMLFNLGNAISGPPTSSGNKKFPKPPIIAGITMKKIITIA